MFLNVLLGVDLSLHFRGEFSRQLFETVKLFHERSLVDVLEIFSGILRIFIDETCALCEREE